METEFDYRYLSGVEASNLGVQEKKKTLIVNHILILPFGVNDSKIVQSPERFLFFFFF